MQNRCVRAYILPSRFSPHKVQAYVTMIEFAGVGSITRVPSRIADCTLRRAIHERPGAISSRKVGSTSSVNALLTNRHSFSGRRSGIGLYVDPILGLREEGGGDSFPRLVGKAPAIKYAELGAGTVEE